MSETGGTDVTPGQVPGLSSTSDAAVDEALSTLVGLEDQPLRAHVAVFDAVHGALQDRLADAEG
ncbi:hypothetical protein [Cellulomonas sp.]|uniref:hypothetical protein n=1 Tax=Cellulomonas sp. TaxID=40001 RepID=UPI003BAB6253